MPRPRRLNDHQEGGLLAQPMEEDEVYIDKQLVISRTRSPSGLILSGSIDHYNAEAVAAALTRELHSPVPGAEGFSDAITGNGDLHLDVSRLEFADVTGIRALVRIAQNSTAGRRLLLRGLPERIRTVIAVVGWSDLPNLVLEEDAE
jgi:ABC-type transporter Mla MlaB component